MPAASTMGGEAAKSDESLRWKMRPMRLALPCRCINFARSALRMQCARRSPATQHITHALAPSVPARCVQVLAAPLPRVERPSLEHFEHFEHR